MIDFNKILDIPPYSLNKREKNELFIDRLCELTKFHQLSRSHQPSLLLKRMFQGNSYQNN